MSDHRMPAPDGYEAPQVEEVLTPDEIQRQVHYAGETSLPVQN